MLSAKPNFKETFSELLTGNWHIDFDYAIQAFNSYIEKIELLNSGASFADLFLDVKKESGILNTVDSYGGTTIISDIKDAEHNSILELSFSGVMRDQDGMCSYGIETFTKSLYQAYSNPYIVGVLLNINSGGGESQSGYTLNQAISDKNKPVVVRTGFCGSAALNGVVTATERIAASENAQIGSIGSMITISSENLKHIKEQYLHIYASVSPNKNIEFRKLLNDDFSGLQKSVDANAKIFQKTVEKNLKLNESLKQETLSGGMFYAQDAKKRGLIDGVGTKQYAIKRILSHIKYKSI